MTSYTEKLAVMNAIHVDLTYNNNAKNIIFEMAHHYRHKWARSRDLKSYLAMTLDTIEHGYSEDSAPNINKTGDVEVKDDKTMWQVSPNGAIVIRRFDFNSQIVGAIYSSISSPHELYFGTGIGIRKDEDVNILKDMLKILLSLGYRLCFGKKEWENFIS